MPATPFTLYSASFVVAKDALATLDTILRKGESSPNGAKLPSARIHEDMKPLTFQVYSACNVVKKVVSHTLDIDLSACWGDEDLVTFDDMYTRIARAQELLASADEGVVNGRGNGTMALKTNVYGTVELPTHAWITSHSLPYMFFFVVTAYAILRKEGVSIGMRDYLEPFNATLERRKEEAV
ncbi:hypothetical protein AK830_g7916 [Neonectria ditissima]|uniref:Uncharacterized protein n=1 Tax=Neonectria ditissima TaxID=78410 RepID=A0A0P7BDQ7_9HYPO|nr:hypothetical protein AK830_g7916 [Neonectria ditissima]